VIELSQVKTYPIAQRRNLVHLSDLMVGLKERNYNAIRIDTALNWCFQKDGSPRGKVAIRATVPGYSHRFKVINHQGGDAVDVLDRLF